MFFNRKKQGAVVREGIVSLEDAPQETGVDFHATTEAALKNVLLMSQQDAFSISLEKVAAILIQSFPKTDVQELIKILARNQTK
jgi:hypothetical protein